MKTMKTMNRERREFFRRFALPVMAGVLTGGGFLVSRPGRAAAAGGVKALDFAPAPSEPRGTM